MSYYSPFYYILAHVKESEAQRLSGVLSVNLTEWEGAVSLVRRGQKGSVGHVTYYQDIRHQFASFFFVFFFVLSDALR